MGDATCWRTALVTGASSGIGEALALEVAGPSVRVALVARRRDRLERVAHAVSARGGEPLVLVCDVGDQAAVRAAAAELRHTFGDVDVAFLNAGVGSSAIAQNLDATEAEHVMRVCYGGVVNWMARLLPAMQKRNQGTIAVTSSLAAYRALPGCGTYCAAKAATSALVESCQVDLQSTRIRLVLVSPYFVETEMTGFDPQRPRRGWLSAEAAARRIVRGARAGKRHIAFPWRFRCFMAFQRLLPSPLHRLFWRVTRPGS